jgi:hypothetical protein
LHTTALRKCGRAAGAGIGIYGVNAQLNMDGVELYGANKIEVQTEVDVDAAIALKVQICDWDDASAAGNFDAVEDALC